MRILLLALVVSTQALAGPLDDADQLLKMILEPIGQASRVNGAVVQIQTDLGSDIPTQLYDVRNVTGKISPAQHRVDDLKRTNRQLDVLMRQLGLKR